MGIRDSQRKKVYTAERSVIETYGRNNLSIKECQQFTNKIATSSFAVRKFGSTDIYVDFGRGGAMAYKNGHWYDDYNEVWRFGNRISLGVWARQEMVVIHEVAHIYASNIASPHGWEFCSIYLDLVRHFLGAKAHADLKASFKAHRVKFVKPREKRILSAGEREAMAGRMMAMRAARMEKVAL